MKNQKVIFKIANDKRAKIYVGGKWIKKVSKVDIYGDVRGYHVTVTRYKTNKNGVPYVEGNEIASETLTYNIKRRVI